LHGFLGAGLAAGHLMERPLASLQGAASTTIGVAAMTMAALHKRLHRCGMGSHRPAAGV